jgi:hypothetical protein
MKARDNPFRAERVEAVPFRFLDGDWGGLMERLDELGGRAAVVGPDGSGKTTLTAELADRLEARGLRIRRLLLNDRRPAFPERFLDAFFDGLRRDDAVVLDGADRMPRRAWARFERRARRAACLVVTSHRPGRLPTLIECRTTPELLDDVARELLGGEGPPAPADELFRRHRGNLRNALRELYDTFAGRCEVQKT